MQDDALKVLIVDDDAMTRIRLTGLIQWEEYGYELLPAASDGAQALETCRRTPPDIVITDMQMPVMDGITFLRALKEIGQSPYILVLSGYDEFSLVRDSMRLGAADYILKLELTAERLLEYLPNREKKENETIRRDKQREQVFRDIINHYFFSAGEVRKRMEETGIVLQGEKVWCFLISAEGVYRFEDSTEEEYRSLAASYIAVTNEVMNDCTTSYAVTGKTGELYVFACLKEEYAGRDELLVWLGERLCDMLNSYLGLSCCVALSGGENTPEGIYRAAKDVGDMICMKYFFAGKKVLLREELGELLHFGQNWNYQLRFELKNALKSLNLQEIEAVFDKAYAKIENASLDERLELMMEFYSCTSEQLEYFGYAPEEYLHDSSILTRNSKGYTSEEVREWFALLKEKLTVWFQKAQNAGSYSGMVEKACRRIEEDYASPINLNQLSAEMCVSPGYLSAMMKKQTGKNFTEYLMGVRIRRAMELLEETDEKLDTVAGNVGFSDPYYFSRQFKKLAGKSPGAWRRERKERAR